MKFTKKIRIYTIVSIIWFILAFILPLARGRVSIAFPIFLGIIPLIIFGGIIWIKDAPKEKED